jgi:prepilin-type N-terminal cleavage/methylation domain-containing protein
VNRNQKVHLDTGFTLIELIVVMAITALLMTAFVINFNAQRAGRNLKIAQNELATNVRKMQSYSLSARDAPTGQPAKFYYLTFSKIANQNGSYTVAAVDKLNATSNIETNNLPKDVVISDLTATTKIGTAITNIECAHVAFALPFSTMYIEYDNLVNGSCTANFPGLQSNPVSLAAISNLRLVIQLKNQISSATTSVTLNSISGVISQP